MEGKGKRKKKARKRKQESREALKLDDKTAGTGIRPMRTPLVRAPNKKDRSFLQVGAVHSTVECIIYLSVAVLVPCNVLGTLCRCSGSVHLPSSYYFLSLSHQTSSFPAPFPFFSPSSLDHCLVALHSPPFLQSSPWRECLSNLSFNSDSPAPSTPPRRVAVSGSQIIA